MANIELRDIGNVALDIQPLTRAGMPPSAIRVVELPAAEMAAAHARGTVASAYIIEPYLSAAMEDNRLLALPYSAIAPPHQRLPHFFQRPTVCVPMPLRLADYKMLSAKSHAGRMPTSRNPGKFW